MEIPPNCLIFHDGIFDNMMHYGKYIIQHLNIRLICQFLKELPFDLLGRYQPMYI